MAAAVRYVTENAKLPKVSKIARLRLPQGDEARRCKEIRDILKDYAARENVSSPLSIAVFGPPGSGKSTCVREILRSLQGSFNKPLLVNLSQLSDPKELADAFSKNFYGCDQNKTDVCFFDEFDAPLQGHPWGWLRWFLGPMQDSELFFEGKTIKIGKAVFVFAGGTAASLAEFEERARQNPKDYRDKKVPDFISRLRGFIDIQGINNLSSERTVRRALALRRQLEKRWPKLKNADGTFPIDKTLVESLLSNVHFVHGVRSMEALLDMCHLGDKLILTRRELPHNNLRKLHLSRGIFDGKTVGISAGQEDEDASLLLFSLTDKLLRSGATLAYGGDPTPGGTLDSLLAAVGKLPDELIDRPDKRLRNYLGFPSFLRPAVREWRKQAKHDVEFLTLETLSDFERDKLGVRGEKWFGARPQTHGEVYNPKHHLAWAISLFRMRARLIGDIDALVVVGGKNGESWGRFSGIAEEVILALTLRKPVYVLGGRGGAASAIGKLLGLDRTLPNPDRCLHDVEIIPQIQEFEHCFRLPGHPNLPDTIASAREFLFNHSITTAGWTSNGLTAVENRDLFSTPIPPKKRRRQVDCVNLILKGLSRLDWNPPKDLAAVSGALGAL